ncbi:hypothetical protein D3C72_2118540 [compost metagenome]
MLRKVAGMCLRDVYTALRFSSRGLASGSRRTSSPRRMASAAWKVGSMAIPAPASAALCRVITSLALMFPDTGTATCWPATAKCHKLCPK